MLTSFLTLVSAKKRRLLDEDFLPYLPECSLLFFENFSDPGASNRWRKSHDPNISGRWKIEYTQPLQSRRFEKCLSTQSNKANSAASYKFREPIIMGDSPLVIQFEARAQFLYTCNTGYITLYTEPDFDPTKLNNETQKFIEFGPEHCHKFNQTRFYVYRDGVKHILKDPFITPVDDIVHQFTLVIRPNNTFSTYIDGRSMRNGTFDLDFEPPVFESGTIEDKSIQKPSNWDDRILIPDPSAVRPSDWDDNAKHHIPDPDHLEPPKGWLLDEPKFLMQTEKDKPKNWNEEKNGKWKPQQIVPNPKCLHVPGCGPYKPPKIRNPNYRGKWRAPLISNPAYKGSWHAPRIENPLAKTLESFSVPAITGIGFNVYGEYHQFGFTNIIIGRDEDAILSWDREDFQARQRKQIRTMKISYNWITSEEPFDRPNGFFGILPYLERVAARRWRKVKDKPLFIAIGSAIVMILIPTGLLLYDCCKPDPFIQEYYRKHPQGYVEYEPENPPDDKDKTE